MQIDNNTISPKFGMALRIKASAQPALRNASKEQLETISRVGEELKSTKHWHLTLGTDLVPTVEGNNSANKYMSYFKAAQKEHNPEFLTLESLNGNTNNAVYGRHIQSIFKIGTPQEVLKAVENINNAPSKIEKASELVKLLETRAERMSKEAETKVDAYKERMDMANKLISKFGEKTEI